MADKWYPALTSLLSGSTNPPTMTPPPAITSVGINGDVNGDDKVDIVVRCR